MTRAQVIANLACPREPRTGLDRVGHTITYIADGYRVTERVGGWLDSFEEKAVTFGKILLFLVGAIFVVVLLK